MGLTLVFQATKTHGVLPLYNSLVKDVNVKVWGPTNVLRNREDQFHMRTMGAVGATLANVWKDLRMDALRHYSYLKYLQWNQTPEKGWSSGKDKSVMETDAYSPTQDWWMFPPAEIILLLFLNFRAARSSNLHYE